MSDLTTGRYLNDVIYDNRVVSIFGIDVPLDAGAMKEFMLRRIDYSKTLKAHLS